ncbi:MAG TPA: alkaline phosphatase family protein [Acidobacteriota bacterium]
MPHTENIILITADGLRYQELFSGADADLLADKKSGIESPAVLRSQFWRPTAEERRLALLPFFWGILAPQGIVLGNKARGSSVQVTNSYRVSYPGYAEILTGQPLPQITGNKEIRIPRETVLEFVRRKFMLSRMGVAAFTSWSVFFYISAHEENGIFCNAGYQPVPHGFATPEMDIFSLLQRRALTPWDSSRHDVFTFELAVDYLKTYQPRLLFMAFDETDDWAHARRYDRVLQLIRLLDDLLKELWQTLQSLEPYRNKTTLILTSDHGRGRGLADWSDHGSKVKGAEDIWLAVVGPDTPERGEVASSPEVYQKQVASTLLRLLGLDYKEFNPEAGPPIALAVR